MAWMDHMAIPAGARDPDDARRFLDLMLKPENGALSSDFTHCASASSGAPALYDDALKASPELSVQEHARMSFTPACPEAATDFMDRVWTCLKT